MRMKSRGSKPRPMISFSSAAAIFALATSTMPGAGGRGGRGRAAREPAAELVDPGDRAAAGADRDHLDRGHPVAPLAEQGVVGGERLAVFDDPDVERGPTHVGGDDVAPAEVVGDAGAADQAADRPGADREDRPVGPQPERAP